MKRVCSFLLVVLLVLSLAPQGLADALSAPKLTLPKEIYAGVKFTVKWNSVSKADSYTITLFTGDRTRKTQWSTQDTSYVVPGRAIPEPGTYELTVSAKHAGYDPGVKTVNITVLPAKATAIPVTKPPVTKAPVTMKPVTIAPVTKAPVTPKPTDVEYITPTPGTLDDLKIYGKSAIFVGESLKVDWTNVSGAVYTLQVFGPANVAGYSWNSLWDNTFTIPGTVFADEGTYVITVNAFLLGGNASASGTVKVTRGVTEPPVYPTTIKSVLYNGAEVIGRSRYATAGSAKNFTVLTGSPYDEIIAWVDNTCVYYGEGTVKKSGSSWGHTFPITFPVGIHTVEFALADGSAAVSGNIASPAGTGAETMYVTYGTYQYSWPKQGYRSGTYLRPGTQVVLRGSLNGFDYITVNGNYTFVEKGQLSYAAPYDPYPYPTAYPAHQHLFINGYCIYCGMPQGSDPAIVIPTAVPAATPRTVTPLKNILALQPGDTVRVSGAVPVNASQTSNLVMLYDNRIIDVDNVSGGFTVHAIKEGNSRLYISYNGMDVVNCQVQVAYATQAPTPTPLPEAPDYSVETLSGADPQALCEDYTQFALFRTLLTDCGVDSTKIKTDDDLKKMLQLVGEEETGLYPALANVIMNAYDGKDEAFKAAFGYDRVVNGSLNYNALMTDLYFTLDDVDLKDPQGCLKSFSAKNGNAFEVASVYIYTIPMTVPDYENLVSQNIQVLLRLQAAAGREYIPYQAQPGTWTCRVLEGGKYLYLTATGVLAGKDSVTLNGDAAAQLGQAAPDTEMSIVLDGREGVYSEAFLQNGVLDYIGLKVVPYGV